MMSDWIGLAVIAVIIIGAMWFFAHVGKPYDATSEEFERRAKEGGGGARAGLFGLMQLLNPKGAKAIEVQRDLKSGYYNKKRVPGDGDETETDKPEGQSPNNFTENNLSDVEDKDA